MAEHNLEGSEWGRSFASRREVVLAANGIVAAAHPFAAQTGLDILKKGGNAIDAAIATAAVCNVVLPSSCGLGGDIFVIYYQAKTGQIVGLNGSGIAPQAATPDHYRALGYGKMPLEGLLAAAVPGQVDAYVTLLEKYGTFALDELFAPAIRYAEEGFPISARLARGIANSHRKLAKFPSTARIFLPRGGPLQPGERLVQRELAESFRKIAKGGRDIFYEGELAEEMVSFSRENGGLFTLRDFAEHRSVVYRPLHTEYRGYTIYETMPPSQGVIVLEELNVLSGFDLAALGFNTAESIHLMVEAKKLAFADRLKYLGDPTFIDNPLDALLSPEYAAQRRKALDLEKAAEWAVGGILPERRGDTTSFVVVDGEGNVCSFIHSLSGGFGCGVAMGETGILLNNRAGRGFTLEEGHPNQLGPGKKTMHTLNTYLICKDGLPWMVGNTPGGDNQPQWNMQVIVNLLDFGMSIQQAIEAPRWSSFPGTDPATIEAPFELRIEERVPESVREELAAKGHRIVVLPPWGGGGTAQGIVIDRQRGILIGGSDPRAEGIVLGY